MVTPTPTGFKVTLVTDALFLAILVAFFALAVLFVKACERIVGADTEAVPADEVVDDTRAAA